MSPTQLSGSPSWTSQPSLCHWPQKRIHHPFGPGSCLIYLAGLFVCGALAGCNGSAQPPLAPRAVPVRPVRVRLLQDVRLLELATTGPHIVTDEEGEVLWRSSSAESVKVRPARRGILLNGRLLARQSLHIKLTSFGTIRIAERTYRGWLRLIRNPSGPSLMVVNHVPLEEYVASVIGSELPSYFHPEAFRAQAVAARTYVLHRMLNTNRSDWDVSDSAASQVYSGLSTETAWALKAQRSTVGEILVFGPQDREEIVCTFYSSTCGGGTRPAWQLKKDVPHIKPLAGVQIDQCEDSPRYRWKTRTFSKSKLRSALAENNAKIRNLGSIELVQIDSHTPQGRAGKIAIVDQRGRRVTVSGASLRQALGLPSDWFEIEDHKSEVWLTKGRGWGHGMGMCQFGADRLARRAYSYDKILSTYYPGSKLVRCY